MDSSTSSTRRQSSRDHAIMFLESLDPTTGLVPEPRTPKRGRYGGTSLRVFSPNRKYRAIAAIEHLRLWQCCRSLLRLYAKLGRGERCRSWRSDRAIAEILARSGLGNYSIHHVRRCRRLLEDIGLIRSTEVRPHSHHGCAGADRCKSGHFPSAAAPDVDGGGLLAKSGGLVVEVNLAAILGEGPRWDGPVREMGWQDARDARDASDEVAKPEASTAGASALEDLGGDAIEGAASSPAAAADPIGAPGGVIIGAQGGVITGAHSCDLGFPSGNLSGDRGPATSDGPGPRAVPAPEAHADAGSCSAEACGSGRRSERPSHDPAAAARASQATRPPSGSDGPSREREPRTKGEQTPRQVLGVDQGAIPPADVKRLRELMPSLDWSWASPRVVPLRGGGGASSSGSAPPAAPPARAPRLFEDLGPIGRNGERPAGWSGGVGGPKGRGS